MEIALLIYGRIPMRSRASLTVAAGGCHAGRAVGTTGWPGSVHGRTAPIHALMVSGPGGAATDGHFGLLSVVLGVRGMLLGALCVCHIVCGVGGFTISNVHVAIEGPLRCKFFAWIALIGRCWIGDRLERHGLPHPASCPFCDQRPETVSHILPGYVFARMVWLGFLRMIGREDLILVEQETLQIWSAWCEASANRTNVRVICLLGMWEL